MQQTSPGENAPPVPASRPSAARRAPRLPLLVGLLLWGLLVVGALYGDSLALPFFSDDFVHLPYVESTGVAAMFRDTGDMAYYRPLTFALWRLFFLAGGGHSALWHHTFNLLVHLGNGLLAGWLASRLWVRQPRLRAYLSATLTWLFPFSYQAVPWSGAVVHLLVTALILLAVAGYLGWRRSGSRGWLLLSLGATVLAPFSHENGVLVGPLVFLVALTRQNGGRLGPALRHGLLWSLPALLWLPLWWAVPKGADSTVGLNSLEGVVQNGVYWLQGLAFPLTIVGGRLVRLGVNDLAGVLVLALPLLALAALVQARTGGPRGHGLLPWLWAAAAWAPALLVLGFDYVVASPRLLVLPGVGIAWLWADVAVRLLPRREAADRGRTARLALVSGALLLALLASGAFISERMGLHRLLGAAVQQAVAVTTQANDQGREALLLNFPAWLAPGERDFALGAEGAVLLPGNEPQSWLVAAQTGEPAALALAEYTDIRAPLPYHLGVAGGGPDWAAAAAARSAVYATAATTETVTLELAGSFDPTPASGPPLAHFANGVSLLAAEAEPGETTTVTLTWRLEYGGAPPATVYVHLLDEAGQLAAQDDGPPLAGTYPFVLWPAGQALADVRLLRGGGTGVGVGLYDPATGERLPAVDASGAPLPDGTVRLPLPQHDE